MSAEIQELEELANREYQFGFVTDIEQESAPPGLNEDIVRFISAKKEEPDWLLDWRLKAFEYWSTNPKMVDPLRRKKAERWAKVD